MFLKDIFFGFTTLYIFQVFFTIFVATAAPHLEFAARVTPSITLTQQSF